MIEEIIIICNVYLVTEVTAPGLAVVRGPVCLPVPGQVAAGAVLFATNIAGESDPL